LPSLPVPPLEDTLSKFVQSVKPFLSDEVQNRVKPCLEHVVHVIVLVSCCCFDPLSQEFEHTTAVVEDFKAGVGAKLQQMLEQRGVDERNWVS
jgi:hypothetical protein